MMTQITSAQAVILAINSFALGGLLFLLSAGFSLIFGLMRIPNLMHGSFFMLGAYFGVSFLDFSDWRKTQHTFVDIAAQRQQGYTLTGLGQAERLNARMVSSNFLRVLGNPSMDAEIHFLEPVAATPDARRRMAEQSRERIVRALGYGD